MTGSREGKHSVHHLVAMAQETGEESNGGVGVEDRQEEANCSLVTQSGGG